MQAVEPTPEADLALVSEAARAAAGIAMRFFRRDPQTWMKPGDSPVSEADIAVDVFLRETLGAARPDYGWLSEETTDTPDRLSARRIFVVDPIDGTRAFLRGLDTWCVSIAVVEGGQPLAGVLDCPALDEIYAAHRGGGAVRNGVPIAVRSPAARPYVGGPKALIGVVPETLRATFAPVPYIPSLAYRIAMVANGAIDATFVKSNSHDWDLAAADLILREAGGGIVDEDGQAPCYARKSTSLGPLVVGSGELLYALAGTIRTRTSNGDRMAAGD